METSEFLLLTVLACVGISSGRYHSDGSWTPDDLASSEKKIFCYFSSYAQTRPSIARFLPEDIDPNLCTHIIFAFVDLKNGRDLTPAAPNHLGPDGLYARTLALKELNPSLKVLISVGGWAIGSEPFIPMLSNPSNRHAFIHNTVRYLRRYGFDGIDMDWEFPGARGSPPDDKFRFTVLLREMQEAFTRESRDTGREKLLLTLATAGGTYFINMAYEPEKIVKYVDYLLLMAYNYHGSWNNFTGHHSGLYPRGDERGDQRKLNQEWTTNYWYRQGALKEKIIVGIATYGMSFTLADSHQHGLGAPSKGNGKAGIYTREPGILSHYEVCKKVSKGWNYVWIEEQKAPYAYRGDQWVGFDDRNSIKFKADFIVENGYAGAFVWSVEMDDFGGHCGEGRYPLITTISNTLRPQDQASKTTYQSPQPKSAVIQSTNHRQYFLPRDGQIKKMDYLDSPPTNQNQVKLARRRSEADARSSGYYTEISSEKDSPDVAADGYDYDYADYDEHPEEQSMYTATIPIVEKRMDNSGTVNKNVQYSLVRRQSNEYTDKMATTPYSDHFMEETELKSTLKQDIFHCPSPGIHGDRKSCNSYYVCIMAGQQWKLYRMKCPLGLGFDEKNKACMVNPNCGLIY